MEPNGMIVQRSPTFDRPIESSVAVAVVLVEGAAVMVIEILGARYLGPFFGSSLYVWSAMIAVTLGSLAVGYWIGGRLADRIASVRPPLAVLAGVGAWALGLPLLVRPILLATDGLGLEGGILASSVLLFSPPLAAFGTISPLVVQLLASRDGAGRSAGRVYALSTVAGVLATLVTAMVLLPRFSLDTIAFATGGVLLSGAAAASLLVGARRPAAAVLALAAVGGAVAAGVDREPDRGDVTVVDEAHGHLGLVRVLDDPGYRFLMIDVGGQTVIERGSLASDMPYVRWMTAVVRIRPELERALAVGLGGGLAIGRLARRGIPTDVVEIEPRVVEMATRHFGFEPTGDLFVEDGRTFLERDGRRYGAVLSDVVGGGTSPAHLLSVEAMRATRRRLTDDGVLVLNYPYAPMPGDEIPRRLAATLGSVFAHIELRSFGPAELRNLVWFASDGPLDGLGGVADAIPSWEADDVLRDRHNPLDRLQIAQAKAFRSWYREVLGPAALLP